MKEFFRDLAIVCFIIAVIFGWSQSRWNKRRQPQFIPHDNRALPMQHIADRRLPPLKILVQGCENQDGLSAEFCIDFTSRVEQLMEITNPKKAAASLELTVLLAPRIEEGKLVISMQIKLDGKTKSFYRFAHPDTVTRKCGIAFSALHSWIINYVQLTAPPEQDLRAAFFCSNKKTASKRPWQHKSYLF
jgi:hypothetical protein